jgi:hypothetical protein
VESTQQWAETTCEYLNVVTRALTSLERTDAFWEHGPDLVVVYLRFLWRLETTLGPPASWSPSMGLDPDLATAFLNVHAARDAQIANAWFVMLKAMAPTSPDERMTFNEETTRAVDACGQFFGIWQMQALQTAIDSALDACPSHIETSHPLARVLRRFGGLILTCRSQTEMSVYFSSGHFADVLSEKSKDDEPDKAMLFACARTWFAHVIRGEPMPIEAAIHATAALERQIRARTIDLVVEDRARQLVARLGIGPVVELEDDCEEFLIQPSAGVVMRHAAKPSHVLAGISQPHAVEGRKASMKIMCALENSIKNGSEPFNAGDTIEIVLFTHPGSIEDMDAS